MSEAQERARRLLAAATPGPWRANNDDRCAWVDTPVAKKLAWLGSQYIDARNTENSELMAAAPELLATLCDELDAANNAQAAEDAAMDHEMSGLRARLHAAEAEIERLRSAVARRRADWVTP